MAIDKVLVGTTDLDLLIAGQDNVKVAYVGDNEFPIYEEPEYFWVKSDSSNCKLAFYAYENYTANFSLDYGSPTLQYSIDKKVWTTLGTTAITLTANTKYYIRGVNPTLGYRAKSYYGGGSISDDDYIIYSRFAFQGSSQASGFSIGGNINSLLDGRGRRDTVAPSCCFYRLFYNANVVLRDASELVLPCVNLPKYYYTEMFYNCTGLVAAPDLPAQILTCRCYKGMFMNCTSLSTTPKMVIKQFMSTNSSDVPSYSCASMFQGCSSLINIQISFYAKEAAYGCYSAMFYGCTQLVNAPNEIFAVVPGFGKYSAANTRVIQPNACRQMFYNCTSLINVPDLTQVVEIKEAGCQEMFYGCTSIELCADIYNVTSIGSSACYSMYYGCTSLKDAIIPNTSSLASYCYYRMFRGCTNLIVLPIINSPSFSASSYSCSEMFYGCTKLIFSASQFTSTFVRNIKLSSSTHATAYNNMFYGISGSVATPVGTTYYYSTNCAVLPFYLKVYDNSDSFEFKFSREGSLGVQDIWQSTDGRGWSPCALNTSYSVSSIKYLACRSDNYTSGTPTAASSIHLDIYDGSGTSTTNPKAEVGGDFGSFSSGGGTTTDKCITSEYSFYHFLYGNTLIYRAENLRFGRKQFGLYTFAELLDECTNLITSPKILARTSAQSVCRNACFADAFSGCTSLITVPDMRGIVDVGASASNSATAGIPLLFYGCTSLTVVPDLSAIISVNGGSEYAVAGASSGGLCGIFGGCTNLAKSTSTKITDFIDCTYFDTAYFDISYTTANKAIPKSQNPLYSTYTMARMYQGAVSASNVCNTTYKYLYRFTQDPVSNQCYNMFSNSGSITTPVIKTIFVNKPVKYYEKPFSIRNIYNGANTVSITNGIGESFFYMKIAPTGVVESTGLIEGNTSITLTNKGYELLLVCASNGYGSQINLNGFSISCSHKFEVSGCINSLVDYWFDVSYHEGSSSMSTGCYSTVLATSNNLFDAKSLSLMSMAYSCAQGLYGDEYSGLFSDCHHLRYPPQLAMYNIELSQQSFYGMFCNCESLRYAPLLSWKYLASGCYEDMFKGCTDLRAPAIIYLDSVNYKDTVISSCYASGAASCYASMYYNCRKLRTRSSSTTKRIPHYYKDIASNYATNMFYGTGDVTTPTAANPVYFDSSIAN